jgi:hypothetical protein
MAVDVETLVVKLEARVTDFEKNLARATKTANTASNSIGNSFAKLNKTVTKSLELLGIGLGAKAFVDFIKSSIEAGKAIADLSAKLGISAEATQELSYAMQQSGASADALAPAFKSMSALVENATRGSKAATDQLAELGIKLSDLKGLTPDKMFEVFLNQIGRLQDPLARTNELVKVFGKQGAELADAAEKGAAGIEALRQSARDAGIILSSETIAKAKDAGDALQTIADVFTADKINLAAQFSGAIEALKDLVTSPAFQSGMETIVKDVGNLVEFLAKLPPGVLAPLLAAAAGFAVAGPGGALTGGLGALGVEAGGQLGGAGIFGPGLSTGGAGVPKTQSIGSAAGAALAAAAQAQSIGSAAGAALAAAAAPATPDLPTLPKPPGPQKPVDTAAIEAQRKKYEELAASIELETKNLTASTEQQYIANEVAKLGADATQKQKDSIADLARSYYELEQRQKQVNDLIDYFSQTAFDAFDQLLSGASDFNSVLQDTLKLLAKAALQSALLGTGPLASIFGTANPAGGTGGLFGAIGNAIAGLFTPRASGGPVMAGNAYRVGEHGPELFVPNVSGQIIAHSSGSTDETRHLIELVVAPEMDARILRVSGPQSQAISFRVVEQAGKQRARQQELSQ